MVEGCTLEGQGEDVGLLEAHVAEASRFDLGFRRGERCGRDVHRDDARARAAARKRHGLRADAAARLEHRGSVRVGGVRVQQIHQRVGLVLQTNVGAPVVAVDVVELHRRVTSGIQFRLRRASGRPCLRGRSLPARRRRDSAMPSNAFTLTTA